MAEVAGAAAAALGAEVVLEEVVEGSEVSAEDRPEEEELAVAGEILDGRSEG